MIQVIYYQCFTIKIKLDVLFLLSSVICTIYDPFFRLLTGKVKLSPDFVEVKYKDPYISITRTVYTAFAELIEDSFTEIVTMSDAGLGEIM